MKEHLSSLIGSKDLCQVKDTFYFHNKIDRKLKKFVSLYRNFFIELFTMSIQRVFLSPTIDHDF